MLKFLRQPERLRQPQYINAIFPDDNNVSVLLYNNETSNTFYNRKNHEVLFRKINMYLINKNLIKGNIIDLGAWIGDNSIPWAKNINGIVYAIDPSSYNCNFIDSICKLNNIKNVKSLQYAISEKEEILSTNDSSNHVSFVYDNLNNDGIYKVTSRSLDFLFETNIIENIGYIHLDVEGMEFRIIKGATKLIDTFHPIITFEQHLELDDYNSIIQYLKAKNYSIYLITEVLLKCRPDCRNFIAFPHNIESVVDDIENYLNIHGLFIKH